MKAYWIAQVTVDDPQAYDAYRAANAAPLAQYGGRFLVRGATAEAVEGAWRDRLVIIEFPDLQAARACYFSDAYQAAKALRDPVACADVCIVEGYGA